MSTDVDYDECGREIPENKVVLALLDCSKSFDRMYRPLLVKKIRSFGVTGHLFVFIVAFFFSRRQRVCVTLFLITSRLFWVDHSVQ